MSVAGESKLPTCGAKPWAIDDVRALRLAYKSRVSGKEVTHNGEEEGDQEEEEEVSKVLVVRWGVAASHRDSSLHHTDGAVSTRRGHKPPPGFELDRVRRSGMLFARS